MIHVLFHIQKCTLKQQFITAMYIDAIFSLSKSKCSVTNILKERLLCFESDFVGSAVSLV